jgi:[ribosomal protein S5]-alanine N-acetyltransferase
VPWWTRIEEPDAVLLRRLVPDDAAGVLAVHGDPRVYVHDLHETHPDLAHTHRFLAPMLEHWEVHDFGYWTVLVGGGAWPGGVPGSQPADGGRLVAGLGGVQHHTVDGQPVLNVYFRFAPEAQGRGLAGAVLRRVADLAREVAPGRDVVVRTRPANAAARRVAERAGYVDEGLEPGTTDMQLLRWVNPAARSGA